VSFLGPGWPPPAIYRQDALNGFCLIHSAIAGEARQPKRGSLIRRLMTCHVAARLAMTAESAHSLHADAFCVYQRQAHLRLSNAQRQGLGTAGTFAHERTPAHVALEPHKVQASAIGFPLAKTLNRLNDEGIKRR
jgi:hypothetical protein